MHWDKVTAGRYEVHDLGDADLTPEGQAALHELVRGLKEGPPFSVLVDVDTAQARPELANVWLDVLDTLGPKLKGLGLVTSSTMVRVVAGFFAAAARMRGHALQVQVFHTTAEARAWLDELDGSGPPRC